MIPGGSYSLQNTETSRQDGQVEGSTKSGATGGSRGIVNNMAFPGATLEADTGNGGSVPNWVWWVAGAAGLIGLGILYLKRK